MTSNESPVAKAETAELGEFEAVKNRLEEIARLVDDDDLPLDDALDLYEEAVKLGLEASSLLEVGIVVEEEPTSEPEGVPGTDPDAFPDPKTVSVPEQG